MKKIVVLDFGGQYAHLIARRIRNLGYYSELALPEVSVDKLTDVCGIILSGSPSSVYNTSRPQFNKEILLLGVPILGLCYGHQFLLEEFGGKVGKAKVGEFGFAELNLVKQSSVFNDISFPTQVWMSHMDEVVDLPEGFEVIGSTKDCNNAAVQNLNKNIFSLQFHAEVKDTIAGNTFLENFIKICQMEKNWDSSMVYKSIKERILKEVGDRKVLLFLSGGVDSSVTFALLSKILGEERVLGLYINNGFMRKNETEKISARYQDNEYTNFMVEDAEKTFLDAVYKMTDPQDKRKMIGETFLTVRDEVVNRLQLDEDEWLLAQGTLYPDIIESGGTTHSHVIKTHHNRVEGIKQLLEKGLIIEPLKELYKDEVRLLGKELGLPDEMIYRHPFPGPGISINLLCSTGKLEDTDTKKFSETVAALKSLDLSHIIPEIPYELSALPVKSVGVQGDLRTYNFPAVFMYEKQDVASINWDNLDKISSHITNNNENVNRVVLKLYENVSCELLEAYCTKDRLDMIREVDAIVLEELRNHDLYNKIFQHLTISLPYASSQKACSIVLRPVISEDVMTARFAKLDPKILLIIINRIKKLDFIDALYYDITNKPPATFGWE